MNIFKRKSKKRSARAKPTVEQEFKKMDLKIRKIAHKQLVDLAMVNPEVKRQLIEREFGIKIPEWDPSKEAIEKIHKVITDKAANTIESNPKLVDNLSQGLIKKYALDLGIRTNDAPGTPFERTIQQIGQYQKIKEALGFKDTNSVWDTIKNPQVVLEFFGLAAQVISMIRSDAKPSELIYVVTVDGKDTEMTEEEYNAYKQRGTMATSSKASHTAGVLTEEAPKAIQRDDDKPGYGIQPIVFPTPQKVAQL